MDALSAIIKRVQQKKEDYATYAFDNVQMTVLNTFFDLAQEYDRVENLYLVIVGVPRVFFGLESNLFLIDPKTDMIKWAANSNTGLKSREDKVPRYIRITRAPYMEADAYIVPIHGRKTHAGSIVFQKPRDIIGIFEVKQASHLPQPKLFFLQKYVNRIGYNLYNKFLAEQSIQHLKFINNLVADMEHNVIAPNIYYKYYFRKIRKYLNTGKEIESELDKLLDELKYKHPEVYARIAEIHERMIVTNRAMFSDQEKIEQHYKHTSLFLETLFRPDHFVYGEYILKKTSCYLWRDIVKPQLQRYRDRFLKQGIAINHILEDLEEAEDIQVRVDKGLLAQVADNFLSNAVKYAEPITDASGKAVKKVDCKMKLLKNFLGKGHDAARFDVFTSGQPIGEDDAANIFEEGFRLGQSEAGQGTGHGLYFVKNVIEVHGGTVGCKAEETGNDFYFIIPVT